MSDFIKFLCPPKMAEKVKPESSRLQITAFDLTDSNTKRSKGKENRLEALKNGLF